MQESRELLIQKEIPIALNSLAMLDELGDMNSNMLEHVLGEPDEKAAYYDNLDEYNSFLSKIPDDINIKQDINRITRLIESTTETAESKIFSYDNKSLERAKQKATDVSDLYGWPLISLLESFYRSETTNPEDTKTQILPLNDKANNEHRLIDPMLQIVKASYQIRLVMDALRGHSYNDLEAKYQFFDELLLLEQGIEDFLVTFEDDLLDASVIEVLRLVSVQARFSAFGR